VLNLFPTLRTLPLERESGVDDLTKVVLAWWVADLRAVGNMLSVIFDVTVVYRW
jgi:hypothetical protein